MATCSRGWADRCKAARSARCRCACGGLNHGNPKAARGGKGQIEMALTNRKELEYGWGEPPTRADVSTRLADKRLVVFTRTADQDARITIDGSALEHRLVVHSPTGLEFGYAGSGPADTALNILALVVPPKEAMRLHQNFKAQMIAGIPKDGGRFTMGDVAQWIHRQYLAEQSDPEQMRREAEMAAQEGDEAWREENRGHHGV